MQVPAKYLINKKSRNRNGPVLTRKAESTFKNISRKIGVLIKVTFTSIEMLACCSAADHCSTVKHDHSSDRRDERMHLTNVSSNYAIKVFTILLLVIQFYNIICS